MLWSNHTHDQRNAQALQEKNKGLEATQQEVAAALEAKSTTVGAMDEERRTLK